MANRWGNSGNSDRLYFLGFQNHCRWWLQLWNQRTFAPWKKSYDQSRQHIKKQRHYFVNKGLSSQSYGFSNSHVWMWEVDYKESWAPKNWCFWTVVLEKTLESPLDCKEIQPVHPRGNQSWIFIGRTDAEAETPILWPPDVKNWFIWKDPDAGKDWRWEEKGKTEDEMFGWHHQFDGHGFEKTPGVGDGQGGLACCSPWGHKESDTTERLNWTDWNFPNFTIQLISKTGVPIIPWLFKITLPVSPVGNYTQYLFHSSKIKQGTEMKIRLLGKKRQEKRTS